MNVIELINNLLTNDAAAINSSENHDSSDEDDDSVRNNDDNSVGNNDDNSVRNNDDSSDYIDENDENFNGDSLVVLKLISSHPLKKMERRSNDDKPRSQEEMALFITEVKHFLEQLIVLDHYYSKDNKKFTSCCCLKHLQHNCCLDALSARLGKSCCFFFFFHLGTYLHFACHFSCFRKSTINHQTNSVKGEDSSRKPAKGRVQEAKGPSCAHRSSQFVQYALPVDSWREQCNRICCLHQCISEHLWYFYSFLENTDESSSFDRTWTYQSW